MGINVIIRLIIIVYDWSWCRVSCRRCLWCFIFLSFFLRFAFSVITRVFSNTFLCVSLYSPCRSAFNFVRLGTLLQLSSYNRFLFLYFPYMQHDYYQRISYQ
jgi:hypothetical protein